MCVCIHASRVKCIFTTYDQWECTAGRFISIAVIKHESNRYLCISGLVFMQHASVTVRDKEKKENKSGMFRKKGRGRHGLQMSS